MDMTRTPTQERFRSWSYGKAPQYQYGSPASETSSGIYFDAEERIRISTTMDDIDDALREQSQPGREDEYQSSEEALSPMLEEERSGDDAEDEETSEDLDAQDEAEESAWAHIELFHTDIAVAICIAAAGKAHIINVPQRWSTFHSRQSSWPVKPAVRSPSLPLRSAARAIPLYLDTNVATPSTAGSLSSTSSRSETPESLYSDKIPATSIHRGNPSNASTTSWAPSSSSHSFLDSDPYETTFPKSSPSRSRLRTFSAKFRSTTSSPAPEQQAEKQSKQKRRRSLIGSAGPETPPFFFSQRSRDQWYRDHPTAQQPDDEPPHSATPPPLSASTPTQRRFPKMVARGANEREPMLELPPCPKGYNQDVPALRASRASTAMESRKSLSADTFRGSRQ